MDSLSATQNNPQRETLPPISAEPFGVIKLMVSLAEPEQSNANPASPILHQSGIPATLGSSSFGTNNFQSATDKSGKLTHGFLVSGLDLAKYSNARLQIPAWGNLAIWARLKPIWQDCFGSASILVVVFCSCCCRRPQGVGGPSDVGGISVSQTSGD